MQMQHDMQMQQQMYMQNGQAMQQTYNGTGHGGTMDGSYYDENQNMQRIQSAPSEIDISKQGAYQSSNNNSGLPPIKNSSVEPGNGSKHDRGSRSMKNSNVVSTDSGGNLSSSMRLAPDNVADDDAASAHVHFSADNSSLNKDPPQNIPNGNQNPNTDQQGYVDDDGEWNEDEADILDSNVNIDDRPKSSRGNTE